MSLLTQRPRRLRANAAWRSMVAETSLSARDFVYPLFVIDGENVVNPIASMPGVAQLSIDKLVEESRRAHALGVPAVILFGIPDHKDPQGSPGYDHDGIVPRAIRALKRRDPDAPRLGRRLPLRVHQPRPLRPADRSRRGGQRRDAAASGAQPRSPTPRPAPT